MEDMSEYIQKGYIRIVDIIPILDDMLIADVPKLSEIGGKGLEIGILIWSFEFGISTEN